MIAEIGANHQGDSDLAVSMVRKAAAAGVGAVKFQKRCNSKLFRKSFYDKPYDSDNSFGETYGAHREVLELSEDAFKQLKDVAAEEDVLFIVTAFDPWSADFLRELDIDAFKIASGDLTNTPLINHVAQMAKPVLLSTGGGSADDVDRAVRAIKEFTSNFSILQCTSGYPPPFAELNLRVIEKLRLLYPENLIGFSGHDNGIAMSLVAYMLGARVIEKHFTLDRSMRGTDHGFSLEPQGLEKLARDLARATVALGSGEKRPTLSEGPALSKMRKAIVANQHLRPGEVLTDSVFGFTIPCEETLGDLPPYQVDQIIGAVVESEILQGEPIRLSHLRL